MTSMMTILNLSGKTSQSRPPDLEGTEKNTPVDTCLPYPYFSFSPRGGSILKILLGEHNIRNLHAWWVVLRVFRVPWCHARMVDAVTRITLF
jgi:hypothetical protein